MIDSQTGERIVVRIHDLYGPYIYISNYEDGGALEDVLDDTYYVLYWKTAPEEGRELGGNEYYFGGAADPAKLQTILDEIIFE